MEEETIKPLYYIIFFNDDYEIMHAVGYEEFPRIADISHMLTEVRDNKEFGLGEDIYVLKMNIIDKEEFDAISN